jgi:hypothetical protein
MTEVAHDAAMKPAGAAAQLIPFRPDHTAGLRAGVEAQ